MSYSETSSMDTLITEDYDSSFVSNTDATICNTADLCSAWGSSLISGPIRTASSNSTSIGDDMIVSGASSSRPFTYNKKQSELEIRIFNVNFSKFYSKSDNKEDEAEKGTESNEQMNDTCSDVVELRKSPRTVEEDVNLINHIQSYGHWNRSLLPNYAEATPKTIMRTMGVKSYPLKSHLQKYRLGKQSAKEATENSKDVSCPAESQDTGSSATGSRVIAQDINDGIQVTEALRVQMEVQRRLHEQLEVQRRLQLRIEAHGKYLHSIIEKACKVPNSQSFESNVLEANREELSELQAKIANSCEGVVTVPSLPYIALSIDNKNTCHVPARLGDCLVDDFLPLDGTPVSPMGIGALKKRSRAFTNTNGLPMESNSRQVDWTMSHNT